MTGSEWRPARGTSRRCTPTLSGLVPQGTSDSAREALVVEQVPRRHCSCQRSDIERRSVDRLPRRIALEGPHWRRGAGSWVSMGKVRSHQATAYYSPLEPNFLSAAFVCRDLACGNLGVHRSAHATSCHRHRRNSIGPHGHKKSAPFSPEKLHLAHLFFGLDSGWSNLGL